MSELVPAKHQWETITYHNETSPCLAAKYGFLGSPLVAMFDAEIVEESPVDELTLWQEEAHAKTSLSLDGVQVWMEAGADCSGTSAVSLMNSMPLGFSGKTSLALSAATAAPTSLPCCGASPGHSLTCPMAGGSPAAWWSDPSGRQSGGCLTLNGSEWPSDGVACSLSAVLEPSVDPKYSLSPRACRGILARAARRGKRLPESLGMALEKVANTSTDLSA